MIYLTTIHPQTKEPTAPSCPSGFASFDDIVAMLGPPLCRGVRTVTYESTFFSDYNFTEFPNK